MKATSRLWFRVWSWGTSGFRHFRIPGAQGSRIGTAREVGSHTQGPSNTAAPQPPATQAQKPLKGNPARTFVLQKQGGEPARGRHGSNLAAGRARSPMREVALGWGVSEAAASTGLEGGSNLAGSDLTGAASDSTAGAGAGAGAGGGFRGVLGLGGRAFCAPEMAPKAP